MCRETVVKKAATPWVLEDLKDSGQQGPQNISPTRIHTHACTHTYTLRYWPDVQDAPIKKAEPNFHFLLHENPNQDRTVFSLLRESRGTKVPFSKQHESPGLQCNSEAGGLFSAICRASTLAKRLYKDCA